MPHLRTLLLLTLMAALAACCPCGTPGRVVTDLPAPITPDEQIIRLNHWSMSLPRIKATTVLAGVRLDYRDEKGQDKSVNAEGILQIRQQDPVPTNTSGAFSYPPADVLLLGKSFDQPAFEAGRNAKDWWFAIRLDTKKAWMGDATLPLNFYGLGDKDSASILRADLIPDLVGITRLKETMTGRSRTNFHVMIVNDDEGTNHVLVAQTDDSATFLQREIIVDRRSGNITEVRLYNRDGILAVRSQLSNYAPVTYAEGVDKPVTYDADGVHSKPAPIPQFPRKVVVTCPAQFLTIALQFETVILPAEFKPAVYMTPDFAGQGLRIIPAD